MGGAISLPLPSRGQKKKMHTYTTMGGKVMVADAAAMAREEEDLRFKYPKGGQGVYRSTF